MADRPEIVALLTYMAQHPEPVGSGKACQVLRQAGFQVSEATVGRLLRWMDLEGLTCRQSYRGRVLTEAGREHIKRLREDQQRLRYSQLLAEQVRSRSLEDLQEILVARRAIEREIARLAAINANSEQIAAMSRLAKTENPSIDDIAQHDVEFHQLLADAAGNSFLRAALNLIRQDAQLSPVLGYIRQQVQSQVFADHRNIAEAVARRDSLAAEQAMVTHIDNLIRDVKKYWSRANGGE